MRARKAVVLGAEIALVVLAACYGTVRYLTSGPNTSFELAQLSFTPDEAELAGRLKRHIDNIGNERNVVHYDELEKTARYIETTLRSYNFDVTSQAFEVGGKNVRNIETVIDGAEGDLAPTIVIGAHYDSAVGTPGADANATGAAALLELARNLTDLKDRSSRRIRLVFFVNKEPPYFQTPDMGSLRYAQALAAREERVTAMYSLEALGYYSNERGTQRHAPLLGLVLPDRGDFVAFIGTLGSRTLVREAVRSFRSYTTFPSFSAFGPSFIPGVDASDHWAFAQQGYRAIMITDTGELRYPHYHKPTDTPDKVDVNKLTRVTRGIESVIRDAVR